MRTLTLLICLLASAAVVAQDKPAPAPSPDNPFTTFNKMAYGTRKRHPDAVRGKNARGELQL